MTAGNHEREQRTDQEFGGPRVGAVVDEVVVVRGEHRRHRRRGEDGEHRRRHPRPRSDGEERDHQDREDEVELLLDRQ